MPLNTSLESNVEKIYVIYGLLRLSVPVIVILLFVRAAKRILELEKKQIICCSVLSLATVYLTMIYDMKFGRYDELPAMNIVCIALFIASLIYYIYLTVHVSKKAHVPAIAVNRL